MGEQTDMPFNFGQGVAFCPLPEWLKEEQILEKLSYDQRQELLRLSFAFVAEYQADSLNTVDSGWTGHTPKSKQAHAIELTHLANLALWLAQPSKIGFEILIHADQPYANTWILQQLHVFHPLIPLAKYTRARLGKNDFELARELYLALTSLTNSSREGVVWTAIHALRQALTEQTWVIRYLLLWVALEALFGPEDAREITFRLSQRVAFFLACDRREAQELFRNYLKTPPGCIIPPPTREVGGETMAKRKRPATIWEVPDDLWERIKALLDAVDPPKKTGRPRADARRILDAILFRCRTGCQWNTIPRVYGDDATIHRTFQRWRRLGVFKRLWALLVAECAELGRVEWQWPAADTALGKARLGGESIGPNPTGRAKRGTTRSLLSEGGGGPLAVAVAAANVHDTTLLEQTLEAVVVPRPEPSEDRPQHVCLDKGDDNPTGHEAVEKYGYVGHIRRIGEEKCGGDQKNTHHGGGS
jgi:putative transposase